MTCFWTVGLIRTRQAALRCDQRHSNGASLQRLHFQGYAPSRSLAGVVRFRGALDAAADTAVGCQDGIQVPAWQAACNVAGTFFRQHFAETLGVCDWSLNNDELTIS